MTGKGRRRARAGAARGGGGASGPGGPKRRLERVGREVRSILAELLLREARDPAMAAVVVTDVKPTSDLSLARVYYRLLVPDEALEKGRRAAERGLKRASGWMRGELGGRLGLRITPELEFHYDEGQDRAMRVNTLLKEIGAGEVVADEAKARREEDDLGHEDDDFGDEDEGFGDDEEEGYGEPPGDED